MLLIGSVFAGFLIFNAIIYGVEKILDHANS